MELKANLHTDNDMSTLCQIFIANIVKLYCDMTEVMGLCSGRSGRGSSSSLFRPFSQDDCSLSTIEFSEYHNLKPWFDVENRDLILVLSRATGSNPARVAENSNQNKVEGGMMFSVVVARAPTKVATWSKYFFPCTDTFLPRPAVPPSSN